VDVHDADEHVTKKEFREFRDNHFAHLYRDVSSIKGQLKIVIPLLFVILTGVITMTASQLFGGY
jgi:hypothetical protein